MEKSEPELETVAVWQQESEEPGDMNAYARALMFVELHLELNQIRSSLGNLTKCVSICGTSQFTVQ